MTVQELKEAVKLLSPQERILLVRYVLGTLELEDGGMSDDWKRELDVRSEAYRKRKAKTSSWIEVKERFNNGRKCKKKRELDIKSNHLCSLQAISLHQEKGLLKTMFY